MNENQFLRLIEAIHALTTQIMMSGAGIIMALGAVILAILAEKWRQK